ncbi:glycosyltransferase family 2 protein [Marilutibacter penaei]|uniref:glycosyltransferase family 2 protein n=1 Tax=Marilutibacter penaei TaxID=2759900 RepID=UPI001FEA9FAE|nr:glycosyltransferase family 2 protein [Lysobacter penaei]
MAELPVVVIPVGTDETSLDACLGALDACTPRGTRVWLADDAESGPRGYALVERWMAGTRLQADYTRRQQRIGPVAHLDEVLRACGDADVVVLSPDARPTPGWLSRLAGCVRGDASIGTATPWCNAGEAAAWPRIGEISPMPDPVAIAGAAASMPTFNPELPAAVEHAVLLRGKARLRAGGLDTDSYGSWYAALADLSLRLAGLGWRNVLCENAFVLREREGRPFDGDMDRLGARWPDWHPRLARFLMQDPLREPRARLHACLVEQDRDDPQRDLFFHAADPADNVGAAVSGEARDAGESGRSGPRSSATEAP